jgi:hypothetical protein
MNKPPLRLGFSSTFKTAELFFTNVLSEYYDVTVDNENPKYLIFGDGNFGYEHNKFNGRAKKIFYTGENVRPSYDTYQNAITFDFENSSRHYRLPLYVIDMWSAVHYENWTKDYLQIHNRDLGDPEENWNRKFCSYVQSNPTSSVRNNFFPRLCEYKNVDAAGPHMNNIGYVIPRDKLGYKIDFLKQYKFNMAFENASYPGYVTEKILNAFQSNTVPIYWGSDNLVHRDFNKKSFINCQDFETFSQVIRYIKHLDSNEGKTEYMDMLYANVFNDNVPNCYTDLHNFYVWWNEFVYEG